MDDFEHFKFISLNEYLDNTIAHFPLSLNEDGCLLLYNFYFIHFNILELRIKIAFRDNQQMMKL